MKKKGIEAPITNKGKALSLDKQYKEIIIYKVGESYKNRSYRIPLNFQIKF